MMKTRSEFGVEERAPKPYAHWLTFNFRESHQDGSKPIAPAIGRMCQTARTPRGEDGPTRGRRFLVGGRSDALARGFCDLEKQMGRQQRIGLTDDRHFRGAGVFSRYGGVSVGEAMQQVVERVVRLIQ